MLTLSEIKNDLRIDHDYDDNYLITLLNASKLFILGTVNLPEATYNDDERFDTLQFMLVSLWYENRVPATNAMQQQVPYTINAMIHQLRGVINDKG